MNDEIKEYVTPTLEYLRECVEDDVRFETSNCKALLDYITNLQEEYRQTKLLKERYQLEKEDYKSRIDKAIEYIKNHTIEWVDEQFEVHNVMVDVDEYFNPEHVIWLLNGGDE